MAIPPDKDARNENLDALELAATGPNGWFTREEKRLDRETTFLKQVLQARGADEVGVLNLFNAVEEMQTEISAYLFVERA